MSITSETKIIKTLRALSVSGQAIEQRANVLFQHKGAVTPAFEQERTKLREDWAELEEEIQILKPAIDNL
jgi:hypothetical protein